MKYKNDEMKDKISEIPKFAYWSSYVLLSCKNQFKAIIVYSIPDVFGMGLCVTSVLPIVHAALIFWYFAPLRNETKSWKKYLYESGWRPTHLIQ